MHTRETPAKGRHLGFTPTTDANMTVTNETAQAFDTQTSNNTHMDDTFPNLHIESGQTSRSYHVSASIFPAQSHFDISYNGEKMTVNIGQGTYVTNVSFSSKDGKAGAVLAPTQPFSTGVDYTFRFFGGSGALPPLLNGLIANNLDDALQYISHNTPSFDLGDDAKITIKKLDLNTNNLRCSYAAISPTQSSGSRLPITAIVDASGGVYGTLAWKGQTNNVSVTFQGFSVLVQATIDTEKSTCTVTELACSVAKCQIDNILLALIQVLNPLLYSVVTTPYHLAGAVNTMFNATIIAKLNAAIAKLWHSTDPARLADAIESIVSAK